MQNRSSPCVSLDSGSIGVLDPLDNLFVILTPVLSDGTLTISETFRVTLPGTLERLATDGSFFYLLAAADGGHAVPVHVSTLDGSGHQNPKLATFADYPAGTVINTRSAAICSFKDDGTAECQPNQ